MKYIPGDKIPVTLAHNMIPRKALIKVGDSKTNLQTINDAYLKAGQFFLPHIHNDSEEIYYFLEGRGIISIDKKEIDIKQGDCILIEAGESHGLKNTGINSLRFITIRTHS